ncbi:MAG: hypothetical protein LBH44_09025 [Treponema sp.]|jgi:hypothetical protein|nr:hypothetical protein [Treponema sp.]
MNIPEKNELSVRLNFAGNEIMVNARLSFNKPLKELTFILNNSLIIDKIENNDYPVKWKKIDEFDFLSMVNSQRIKVTCKYPITELNLTYHGSIAGTSYYNVLTEAIKALSFYSVWFPQEFPFEINHDEVFIENGEDLFVVKGTFDEKNNTWHYGGEEFHPFNLALYEKNVINGDGFDPFNIIAYKKSALKTVSNDYFNVFYVDNSIEKYAQKAEEVYRNIVKFFNGSLFGKKELPILDIACVSPALKTGGGYQRKGLMFATDLGNDDLYLTWFLSHETAHNWCGGASVFTWEDWLNETTAEWAVLLYALNENNDALFQSIIDGKIKKAGNYPPIKTKDGSRPEGVHDKGTILFYEIYKKHGKDVVTKMVRGFTDLETKDTEHFIKMVEQEIGQEVANEIKKGIES